MSESIESHEEGIDPEQEVLLADSVGLALLVVLDTLPPAERLAFVLHDIFAVPFDEIAPIVERSETAARQLASRARRRVRGAETAKIADLNASEKWSMPSSPPRAPGTLTHCSRCSTRTSCSAPTLLPHSGRVQRSPRRDGRCQAVRRTCSGRTNRSRGWSRGSYCGVA